MAEKEVRYLAARELRADEGERGPMISGYAAVFNALSLDLGGFVERIQPGAFAASLVEDDQRALWNHNADLILGRRKAGTLELEEDETGLRFVINPPDTQAGRDALASLKRGDVDQMSFSFYVQEDGWEKDGGQIVRTLKKVKVMEVSPVTFPAYPQTSAFVRSQIEALSRQGPVDGDGAQQEQAQARERRAARVKNLKRKIRILAADCGQ